MGIVNRRNAALGWLTWLAGKRWLRRKARRAVPATAQEVKRRRGPTASLAGLAALGGALLFWRKRSGGGSDIETRD